VKEFQIKELPPEDQVERMILHYNETHRDQLNVRNMCKFYRDLVTLGTFKEVMRVNKVSRPTMFRYKKAFKLIGITESNIIPLTEEGLPVAEVNLRDYHYELMYNRHFLNKNSFLDIQHEWAANDKHSSGKPLH
jgi:hypothetical protein